MRDFIKVFVNDQITAVSFGGASVAQEIKFVETQNDDRVEILTVKIGTNDLSRNHITLELRRQTCCFASEMRLKRCIGQDL